LQFAMSVEPPFNRSETRAHTPQADVTTVLTHSADPERASALVRLLNYGLSGPQGARARQLHRWRRRQRRLVGHHDV
jgi:hypothetical protein